ncbi:hypothetical protein CDD83_697 [Cordyceps sp. RAO-2017]|nr:hypothetical protein CDD83_697 [Cordyceps sp. RAO-2017]
MSCACRILPWSIFVQGLARVHGLEPTSARAAVLAAPTIPRATARGRSLEAPWQRRGFHRTERRPDSGPDTSAVEKQSVSSEAPEPPASSPQLPPAPIEAAEASLERPRKRAQSRAERREQDSEADAQRRPTSPEQVSEADAQQAVPGRSSKAPRKAKTKASRLDAAEDGGGPDEPPREKFNMKEAWRVHKDRIKEKFPEGWKPRKRLSPDALAGIRALNAQFPDVYTTSALATKFKMDPEAIRRVLKSSWQPTAEQEQERQERWHRRGMQVWERKAELGIKPPRKWRKEGIARDPSYHERRKWASQREKEWEEEEIRKYREERRARLGGGKAAAGEAPSGEKP